MDICIFRDMLYMCFYMFRNTKPLMVPEHTDTQMTIFSTKHIAGPDRVSNRVTLSEELQLGILKTKLISTHLPPNLWCNS
jgi:hypothetical protein